MLAEVEHCDRALKYVSQWQTAVDAGAHKGYWTEKLVEHFDSVHAFEPVAELAAEITGRAHVHVHALGARYGQCAIEHGRDNNGQGHVTGGTDVEMKPLDDYTLGGVGFFKLDVEGYELRVLEGASSMVERCRPVILCELNGLSARYGWTDDDVKLWLTRQGYRHEATWNKDWLWLPE